MIPWLNELFGKLLSFFACATIGLIFGSIVGGQEVADLAPWLLYVFAACVLGFIVSLVCKVIFGQLTVALSTKEWNSQSGPSRSSRANSSILQLLKLPFYLIFGAGVGWLFGNLFLDRNPEFLPYGVYVVIIACQVGWILMLLIWLIEFRIRLWLRRPTNSPPAHLPEVPPPKAYDGRLAQFLECPEEELHREEKEPVSTMPFWSRFAFWTRSSPKSVSAIRVVLEPAFGVRCRDVGIIDVIKGLPLHFPLAAWALVPVSSATQANRG